MSGDLRVGGGREQVDQLVEGVKAGQSQRVRVAGGRHERYTDQVGQVQDEPVT